VILLRISLLRLPHFGDLNRHLLLISGKLVNALSHYGECKRYGLQVLRTRRRDGGRGRLDHSCLSR
jgi:hypothetical protein